MKATKYLKAIRKLYSETCVCEGEKSTKVYTILNYHGQYQIDMFLITPPQVSSVDE